MSIDYKSIGKRIKRFRMERSLSQENLGEMISSTGNHISRIERGMRIPSVDTLILIANALHVTSDDLLIDSLSQFSATSEIELQRLIADCNEDERRIIIRLLQFMKDLLKEHGI